MHQVQIDVIQAQVLQTLFQSLFHPAVVSAPQLGSNEKVLPLHLSRGEGIADALSDLLFVLVAESAIDVSVAYRDGVTDSLLNLTGLGLPGTWSISTTIAAMCQNGTLHTETQCRDLCSSVELESSVGNGHGVSSMCVIEYRFVTDSRKAEE